MPADLKELGKKGASGNCVHIVGIKFEEDEDHWDAGERIIISTPYGWKCPIQKTHVTDACICHEWKGPAPGTELVPMEPIKIGG